MDEYKKGKARFKNFRIIFDSGCSNTIVMGRPVEINIPKKYYVMQCHTEVGNITTNLKVEVEFTLPEISVTNFMACKYHVDESDKGRYNMILGRDSFTELGLKI